MSINVLTATPSESDFIGSQKSCGICHVETSKYTCPRCNLPYCSVVCFKHQKHSGCSESFHKDCFVEELKQTRASNDEKRRIMDMLKALEKQDDIEDQSLEDRLRGLNLDSLDAEDLWDKLTPEERDGFTNSIQSGSCGITPWQPWWTYHDKGLVAEIGVSHNTDAFQSTGRLPVPTPALKIPGLSSLLRGTQTSPLVSNNIVNVFYCYAFSCHVYNGAVDDFVEEFVCDTIETSQFLRQGKTLPSCGEAIYAAMESCAERHGNLVNKQVLVETILDVYHIFLGKTKEEPHVYAVGCIGELHRTCKRYRQSIQRQQRRQSLGTKDVFQVQKKLEFLLAWVDDNKEELLPLAFKVLSVYEMQKSNLIEHETVAPQVDQMRREKAQKRSNKVLIQEMD